MRKLALLVVLALSLAGCSPSQDPTNQDPSNQDQTSQSPSAENQETTEENLTVSEVIELSYEAFETKGMTEVVQSEGQTYKLLYDPTMEDYQAVLVEELSGEAQLIFETDYFTLFVIYLISQSPDGLIEDQGDGRYLAQDENYGNFYFQVLDNLIVSAEGKDATWSAEFNYEVDPELKVLLLEQRQVLLDSFEE